jgi:hypothetical protein
MTTILKQLEDAAICQFQAGRISTDMSTSRVVNRAFLYLSTMAGKGKLNTMVNICFFGRLVNWHDYRNDIFKMGRG